MNFTHLLNFIQIVEWGNISKAATFLNIAQPALSRQIQSLEESLGVKLLMRYSWGVTPTADGKILLEHAHRIEKEYQSARELIQKNHDKPIGRAVLGVPSAYAVSLIPDLLQRMRISYPNIDIRVAEAFSGTIYEWLYSGRLDLAILYQTEDKVAAVTTDFFNEDFAFICSTDMYNDRAEIRLSEISGMKLIVPWRPHMVRLILESAFLSNAISFNPAIEIDSLPCMKELVHRGEGVTILPPSSVAREIQSGRLKAIPITSPNIKLTMMIGRPAGRSISPVIKIIIDELQKLAVDLAPSLKWECTFPTGDK
ncbi:LysR family transcriptional regulator [Sneathiella sp.]|uniref:LysR family transcriptional regulator n=1 Tax=Sneathiella sp. TaxID=1964365 RepID=UPI0035673AD9